MNYVPLSEFKKLLATNSQTSPRYRQTYPANVRGCIAALSDDNACAVFGVLPDGSRKVIKR